MKRLRAFWEIEPDMVVGKVFGALLEYACTIGTVDEADRTKAVDIINRLQGKSVNKKDEPKTDQDFLDQEFKTINWSRLSLDAELQPIIKQRLEEIQKALRAEAVLSVIFLCGSTLEGLLQDAASKNAQQFNQAKSAPKNERGEVKKLQKWTLNALIDVSHEVKLLSLDVKKHGHSLRDFRNYIHPREQVLCGFNPDIHTAKISWQVLQAAIASLSGQRE